MFSLEKFVTLQLSTFATQSLTLRDLGSGISPGPERSELPGGFIPRGVHGVGDGRKIYWTLPPRAKTIRCGTVQRAKDYAETAVARRRSHRYELLAGNIAIWRRRANRGADLEQALATILFVDIVRSTETPDGWAIRVGHR